jgi:putative transposase
MGLESRGWQTPGDLPGLMLRSDNGAQPCSNRFVQYLGSVGIRGQYTGYNAPDDNAFVERMIRTIREEEIWLNSWASWEEAHAAIEAYVRFYNQQRVHSALGYRTPKEFAAEMKSLKAA